MKFSEIQLHEHILEAISYMGFENTTPIQEQAIPFILDHHDLIACAQTGTGKTAAFILPVLDHLDKSERKGISTLIIVPTRELALQIDKQIQGFAYFLSINSLAIYGGGDGMEWEQQKKAIIQNTDILVATPGKLMSHLDLGYVKFDHLQHLILDEADRMLDMGFFDDIKKIMSYIPNKRQTLMFSATMPPKIRELAGHILHNPKEISIAMSKPAEGVLQAAYLSYDYQKTALIKSLIQDKPEYQSILIFSSTKKKVTEIIKTLRNKDYHVEGVSSDFEQREREEVLSRFASKNTRVLVATDVLSRGIDIKDIELIINYDVPGDAEDYVHRVGRTARADKTGVALTLVNEDDMFRFKKIESLIGSEIMKLQPPKELGEGPAWNDHARPSKKTYGKGSYGRKNQGRKK